MPLMDDTGRTEWGRRVSQRAAIAPFLAMEIAREASLKAAAGADIVRFDLGQPHVGAPEAAIAAAERALRTQRLGYTDALGSDALREAIAGLYRRRHGVTVDPGRVVVTTGASGAFLMTFLALFETGDRVALAAPAYPPYRHILTALGMTPVAVEAREEDRLQMTGETLARTPGPLAGALIASPANPTGVILSKAELADIAAAARARGAFLVSDEIYHGLTYETPAETALAVDPDAIVINSFSKYWAMTGWRVGWLVAPAHLIRPIERLAQNLAICAPTPAQAAALAALDAEEECEARRADYGVNRALLLEALPRLGLHPLAHPDGAFYMLADITEHSNDSAAFCAAALAEAGVAMTTGLDFDDARGKRWVRLAYPITERETREGLARLARFLKRA
ncbi:MAG: aminotransferase class I/II-fold pyridoxal phosphate-dependent enzyme [Hyphomonadaceae bacterium]